MTACTVHIINVKKNVNIIWLYVIKLYAHKYRQHVGTYLIVNTKQAIHVTVFITV